MLFCSEEFLVFFVIVFAAYWASPWQRLRTYLLLVSSFYFYYSWSPTLACIVVVSSLANFALARWLDATPSNQRKRLCLWISVGGNLSLLGYFKYANFFLDPVRRVLETAGFESSWPVLRIVVPIGISFYTFEAINYIVDIFRGRARAERDPVHFLVFILFFPHLVAGPIVRACDFLPQIRRRKRWSWPRLETGTRLFLVGLFKKLAIADRMVPFVDPVFANPGDYGPTAAWIAVLAYSVQIYCDFSGYTDMARGTARLLGFHLAPNFAVPYFALNIADFWRRWHISLSSWLKDYLFIPLGGSRAGRWLTSRNLLLTMALGGLWHGASWTFVAWGVLHGLLLIVHRWFRETCAAWPRLEGWLATWPGILGRVGPTYLVVCLLWVFFRAQSFEAALTLLTRLTALFEGLPAPMDPSSFLTLFLLVTAAQLAWTTGLWHQVERRAPALALGGGYALMLTLALVLAPENARAFIYFQF